MKYPTAALILQGVALLATLAAIAVAAYVFHSDKKWYDKVGGDNEQIYFTAIKQKLMERWYMMTYDVNPDFKPHHQPRMYPTEGQFGDFLRYTKSEPAIFIACLVIGAVIQIICLVVTIVRKKQFLPRPCRENGFFQLIAAIVLIFGGAAELTNRISIYKSYDNYGSFEKDPDPNTQTGAQMLGSCGKRHSQYESRLGTKKIQERDDLHVCQAWYGFIASMILLVIAALVLFAVFFLLWFFWRKKSNVEQADQESIDRELGQKDGGEDESASTAPSKGRGRSLTPKKGKKKEKSLKKSKSKSKSKASKSKSKSPKKSKSKTKSKSPKKKSPKKSKSKSKSAKSSKKSKKAGGKPSKKPSKKSTAKSKSKTPTNKPSKTKSKSPATDKSPKK